MSAAASIVKRGTPSLWPHEISPITNPKDPRYQPERLEMAIPDEEIRTFATLGQIQPISVRINAREEVEIVEGAQRFKRASVINAVVGVHEYTGNIVAVKEAIARAKANGLGKFLAAECPSGVKLKFDLYRGDEKEAARAQTVANEQRHDDPITVKVKRAHRLAKAGFSHEDIAQDFGHPDASTVKRWLARDPDKPKERKARTTKVKPGPVRTATAFDHLNGIAKKSDATKAALAIIGWLRGDVTAEDMAKAVPELDGVEL